MEQALDLMQRIAHLPPAQALGFIIGQDEENILKNIEFKKLFAWIVTMDKARELIDNYFHGKTYLKENLQNITHEQPIISVAATGVNNAVELIDSTKQTEIMNVDYNNVINRSEVNYSDGNTLINTYSKIYPLRKEEVQLDNTLSEYKEEQAEIDELKEKINKMEKKIDEIQVEMKTYNQVELELQEAVAKKAALDNDISNLQSELTDCNASDEITRTKIQSQETEISILDSKLKGKQETFNQTLTKERTLASQFNTLQSRMDYLNQQSCDGKIYISKLNRSDGSRCYGVCSNVPVTIYWINPTNTNPGGNGTTEQDIYNFLGTIKQSDLSGKLQKSYDMWNSGNIWTANADWTQSFFYWVVAIRNDNLQPIAVGNWDSANNNGYIEDIGCN